jgi:5-methylcytosine-specific restriction enzyme A
MPFRPPIHRPHGKRPSATILEFRGTAAQRGYDAHWRRLRALYLQRNPLCVVCESDGRCTPATVVDHIKPIAEEPELRLVESNLRSLCKHHHDQHTARTRGWGRARRPEK